jgi:NADPH:quinone reductase-like Zn-dependent oxidoreductase
MRTILYRRNGDPAQVLELSEVDAPPAPADGEVLVRVLLRPVHYGDLLGIAGRYRSRGDTTPLPEGGNRVGFEGMGIVQAVGHGVDLRIGTRVAFFPGRAAWSEQAIVPVDFVTPIPDDVSNEVAAQLHVNPLTAALLFRAAVQSGVAQDDGVVVMTAAGSAVAKLTTELARKAGLNVVSIVRSTSGAADLMRLHPDVPVIATDQHNWREKLRAATHGQPVKVVLDAVGGSVASELIAMLGNGGSLISYGDLSGEPITATALAFSTRNIRIFGVTVGTWAGLPKSQRDEDLKVALSLAHDEPNLFPVTATYDLADVREAAAHVELPGKGGVVLLSSN